RAYCLKTQPATGETYPKSDLFNKAGMDQKSCKLVFIVVRCMLFYPFRFWLQAGKLFIPAVIVLFCE
ncbi:hypothetical protein, partial [Klebsiella pneumoniae]